MAYFSRRNEYLVEYSGHEEVSLELGNRLAAIIDSYLNKNYARKEAFLRKVYMEFPKKARYTDFRGLFSSCSFDEIFSITEMFLENQGVLSNVSGHCQAWLDVEEALELSGSVYELDQNQVVLKVNEDLAEKVDSIKNVLAPYPEFSARFFQAVGNLMGRKAKPEDVVKDVFVASEGYLKAVTKTSRFGDAIKYLFKNSFINKEQKKVLEALHEFRSDADGAGHAGNSITPTEETALWFLDTLVAQLRMIHKSVS